MMLRRDNLVPTFAYLSSEESKAQRVEYILEHYSGLDVKSRMKILAETMTQTEEIPPGFTLSEYQEVLSGNEKIFLVYLIMQYGKENQKATVQ